LVKALEADWATMRTLDENGELVLSASAGQAPDGAQPQSHLQPELLPPNLRSIALGETVLINDYRTYPERIKQIAELGLSSLAVVPVKVRGQTIGVAGFASLSKGHFTPQRASLLSSIVKGIGVHFHNAQLQEAESRRSRELEAISTSADILTQPIPLDQRMSRVLEILINVVGAGWGTLRMGDGDGDLILLASAGRAPEGLAPEKYLKTLARLVYQAFESGEAIIANNYDSNPEASKDVVGFGLKSFAVLPIKAEGETLGVVTISSTQRHHFTPERVMLLKSVVGGLGTHFRNARFQEKVEQTLAELQQAQDQILRQERLRGLGIMASGIAHDFNNVLTPILGYSHMLLKHPEILRDEEQVKLFMQDINTAARDGAEIVSRMQEFYRHHEKAEVMSVTDLNRVVEETVAMTRPRWKDMAQSSGSDIDLRVEVAGDLPVISGSEGGLRSLLTNLIFNGVDAMPNGGTLTISTSHTDHTVELRVSDTGTGMSEDVRRRAMEPFFTTKAESGSGLGLTMVHEIVKRHRGNIDVESELDRGTTIVITLPTIDRTFSITFPIS